MKSIAVLVLALSVGGLLSPLFRPSNSRALSQEGLERFERGEYAEAAELFEQSRELDAAAENTFDLGTSLIGAKEHARGEELLGSLAADDTMAAPSLYNAGNSQLSRGALDEAVESYTEALRISPTNVSAKRNLEIALRRREQQEQRGVSGPGENEGEEQEQSSTGRDEEESSALDPDLERVLRSIEQQEREELARMRRANATQRPTDW